MLNRHSQKDQDTVFKTDYRLIQVKSIAECSLSTFMKLPVVINTVVVSICEWQFYTGITVLAIDYKM